MELRIIYKNREIVELQLTQNGGLVDMLIMPLDPALGDKKPSAGEDKLVHKGGVDFHFDTVLVTSIDKIFKRNRIDRVSPLEVILEGFDEESSMASLIAQTVVEALKVK